MKSRWPGGVLRRPLFWLIVQLIGVFAFIAWSGDLKTVRVADTLSYLNAAQAEDLTDVLSRHRTFAYPLFLRTVASFGRWTAPA